MLAQNTNPKSLKENNDSLEFTPYNYKSLLFHIDPVEYCFLK